MKAYRKIIGVAAVAICLIIVVVTFIKVKGINSSDKLVLQLAHNQSAGSEIADSIAKVSDYVAQESGDEVNIKIFASGVLGTEKEEIEMVKAGIIDMAKVSSNTLGQFDDRYAIFAIPYLFKNQEHYYNAMEKSEAVKELFNDTADDGYIAVGYYANGARNFYLKDDIAVTDTTVLNGKKIRSMPSSTSMDMIEKMGGTPVPMAASETYASLQQGVVDGAENTELALTVDGHEDLVKSYTYTEHQFSPDIFIISTKTWNKMTEKQRQSLITALEETNDNFKSLYNGMMDEAIKEAESKGVHVYRDIDKTPFIEAVQPIHESFFNKGEAYKKLYVAIIKNAKSNKMGKKDIIKVECPIEALDLDILGFIDHNITVNVIKGDRIVEKKELKLPKQVKNVIKCKNPRCVTSIEQELDQIFILADEEKEVYRCKYCEEKYTNPNRRQIKVM